MARPSMCTAVRALLLVLLVLLVPAAAGARASAPANNSHNTRAAGWRWREVDGGHRLGGGGAVFSNGHDGYVWYFVPAMARLPDGRLLAFAEAHNTSVQVWPASE